MVDSIEAYCSGLLSKHNGFMRFLFSLLSNFIFAHCLLHCLLIVNVRSETKYSSPRKQWNSYDMHVQYFNINSQRFNSIQITQLAISIAPFLVIKVSLLLSVFLFPWRHMEIIPNNASCNKVGGEGEVFVKRRLKCLFEFLQKLTSFQIYCKVDMTRLS